MSEMEAGRESWRKNVGENHQRGVILGYWDHEKTSELIQDLEQSVNFIEKKCKKLLEELVQYKKYLEKFGELNSQLTTSEEKSQESRSSHLLSQSDPDIAFRKNLINFQKMQKIFEEKFQEKLFNINEKLTETAGKIGLKNNIILLSTNDCLKTLERRTEDGEEEEEEYLLRDFLETLTKSDQPFMTEQWNETSEFSKITQNELKLYQKLSRLGMRRKKKRKKPKGRKVTFFKRKRVGKKKTPRCHQGLEFERKSAKVGEKKLKKRRKAFDLTKKEKDRSSRDSNSTAQSQQKSNESEVEKMCKTLTENVENKEFKSKADDLKFKSNLGAAIRKTVPFTICTSTSRSYNIGLNIQELLSLSKRKKKSSVSGSTMAPNTKAVEFKENSFNFNDRKARSKYTGTSTGNVLEYHKSIMSQYTNGRKSMIKSESKSAYAVGSKIVVSDCQRTDIFEIEKNNNENASGDGNCNGRCIKLNMEWTKVYNSFLSIYKKYNYLKKKISRSDSVLADEELNSLENEIEHSIGKYKEFLNFYFKFINLDHRLKLHKISCETKSHEPVTSFSSYCQEKLWQCRPTSIMTLKKVFREIQALQSKIKLIND